MTFAELFTILGVADKAIRGIAAYIDLDDEVAPEKLAELAAKTDDAINKWRRN